MDSIDITTGLVIGGASAFLAALLTQMVLTNDPVMRRGLRFCAYAFLLLGVSLPSVLLVSEADASLPRLMLAGGPLISLAIFGHGFAVIHGRTPRFELLLAAAGACAVAITWSALVDERALALAVAWGCVLYSLLLLAYCWDNLRSPQVLAERVFGSVLLGVLGISFIRLVQTIAYKGPDIPNLLYVPQSHLWFHALFYGIMPLMTGVLLFSLINARLALTLHGYVNTDELTRALSRRGLRAAAQQLLVQAARSRREVLIMMLDLDHFKQINDRYGHQTGDDVLREVANALQAELREDSLFCRYGGEEFVAVVPYDRPPIDNVLAERMRRAVRRLSMTSPQGVRIPLSVSIGCASVAMSHPPEQAFEIAIQRADEAMYLAKQAGRDCVRLNLAVV
jgi:diguanylate cyclase (GGDEF)-like protein